MIKLSIAVCTFNRSQSLKECLQSLTEQSFTDFEVVIVDGNSTDQTQSVIDEYSLKLRIKKVIDAGQGLAQARDLGWRQASGELVAWIDDDVVVSKDWAEAVVSTLDSNQKIAGVSGPTIIKKELLIKRDVFSFYYRQGIMAWLGKFWNSFFLENKMYEVGRLFKSGAWSPGANFEQSLEIDGIKEVDYLEACNMTLRRELIEKVSGFDFNYLSVAEWSELDLAIRIKKLGYLLVFDPKAWVNHNISQGGIYPKRAQAQQRMENFFRFYFKHVFKPKLSYLFKFSCYVIFLNCYWLYKALSTKNINWLGGWIGTISGLLKLTRKVNYNPKTYNK